MKVNLNEIECRSDMDEAGVVELDVVGIHDPVPDIRLVRHRPGERPRHVDHVFRADRRPTEHRGDGYSLHFDNIVDALIDEISGADAMVACVAWLTHEALLRAASRIPASFLVQKEDFLRPDSKKMSQGDLRGSYEKGPVFGSRWDLGLVGNLSYAGDVGIDRVRCVGAAAKAGVTTPKMHHKFAVFGDWGAKGADPDFGRFVPKSVAMGSFNWTNNATSSLENVMSCGNS